MASHSYFVLGISFIFACIYMSKCYAINDYPKVHIVYMGALPKTPYSPTSHHLRMLQQVFDCSNATNFLVHSYKRSFNGFAAMLTNQQKVKLTQMKGVVSVFPSRTLKTQTTRSWDFMGFPESVKRRHAVENNVVVGVIDSGIWPESESFGDKGFGTLPKKWKGACVGGVNFTCNKKIIGARFYVDDSARDKVGHGSHTASIAAGDTVHGASFYGLAKGNARGGVPSARIAAYKVCSSEQCEDAAILAAFDDAISDGVDIISISIGTDDPQDFYGDSIAIGSFHAMAKGILTVNSAGNSGPHLSSVSSVAPWMLTVAASTKDRKFIDKVILGNGKTLVGKSVNSFKSNGTKFPIAKRNDDGKECQDSSDYIEDCGCLSSHLVKGKIVLCGNGNGLDAFGAGPIGAIRMDHVGAGSEAFVTPFPLLSLSRQDYKHIRSYTDSVKYPEAEILKSEVIEDHTAPIVADFSSRGPNGIVSEILKPDIAAPGVDILAAYPPSVSPSGNPNDKRSTKYNILSGTSMSCPHVTGIAAYLKTFHLGWSPAAIKSAIMTSAKPMTSSKLDIGEFAYGSGQVNPIQAIHPGLVYDISSEDYLQMLCNLGYDSQKIKQISGKYNPCLKAPNRSLVRNLNYPAFAKSFRPMTSFSFRFKRTVTNVGIANSTYKANILPNPKINIRVTPEILSFKSLYEKQSFVVTITGGKFPDETALISSLVWSDGNHIVRSPIIIYITCEKSLGERLY